MMHKYSILLLLSLFCFHICYCQKDENSSVKIKSFTPDDDLLYKSEFVWGVNFNTIGGLIGGLYLKKAKALNKRLYRSMSLEIVNIKHNKEIRWQIQSGGNVIVNKRNYFFVIRPQYGKELVLFQKARKQGIQVNVLAAMGPTFGLLAPYLIEYNYREDSRSSKDGIEVEQYDASFHNINLILGSGHLTESISQSIIVPGVSLKMSLSFEMGTFKSSVSGFEAGFMLDAYSKQIEILQSAPKQSVYTSAFVIFYYGSRK